MYPIRFRQSWHREANCRISFHVDGIIIIVNLSRPSQSRIQEIPPHCEFPSISSIATVEGWLKHESREDLEVAMAPENPVHQKPEDDNKTKAAPISFSFTDLPAEIRNMIYCTWNHLAGNESISLQHDPPVRQPLTLYMPGPDDISSHSNCFGVERAHHVLVKFHVAHLKIES